MKIKQKLWTKDAGWDSVDLDSGFKPQLAFVFGDTGVLNLDIINDIPKWLPESQIIYISTAGFIYGDDVFDNSILITAIEFGKTKVQCIETMISDPKDSEKAGIELANKIDKNGLRHAMLFSEGLIVRGAELVKGVNSILSPLGIATTGGQAGDWPNIQKTFVGLNKRPSDTRIIMLGFYGDDIKIGYGSFGGWDIFGPERVITRAKGNVLYELDGKPALNVYKDYLGTKAEGLPRSGLLFPLQVSIESPDGLDYVIRNLIGVNEDDGGLVFAAGDMVEGATVRMMKGNFDRLVEGANKAANMSLVNVQQPIEFAFLVSCMGRRMVLKDRVAEEIDAAREIFAGAGAGAGAGAVLTGFYSYAEICPVSPQEKQCRLHNQTMTITTFSEK